MTDNFLDTGSLDRRIICTEFYDGAVSGLIEISTGSLRYFSFELLAWSENHDDRIYLFSNSDRPFFKRVANAASSQGAPSWPFWVIKLGSPLPKLPPAFIVRSDSYLGEVKGCAWIDSDRLKARSGAHRFDSRYFDEWLREFK